MYLPPYCESIVLLKYATSFCYVIKGIYADIDVEPRKYRSIRRKRCFVKYIVELPTRRKSNTARYLYEISWPQTLLATATLQTYYSSSSFDRHRRLPSKREKRSSSNPTNANFQFLRFFSSVRYLIILFLKIRNKIATVKFSVNVQTD